SGSDRPRPEVANPPPNRCRGARLARRPTPGGRAVPPPPPGRSGGRPTPRLAIPPRPPCATPATRSRCVTPPPRRRLSEAGRCAGRPGAPGGAQGGEQFVGQALTVAQRRARHPIAQPGPQLGQPAGVL